MGVLADASGADRYYCEPYAEKVGRADYHSDYLVASSNAQGVGSGRRGDGSDGHAWAGGLGVLVDLAGDDHYEAGNWSQGTGYWFGTGILYDGDGDDLYRSVYFTQASGAHFAIGAIIDEAGDDRHELFENAGAGLAFGWDFTNALLFDRSGNDHYEAKIISLGLAEIRSNAFLVDLDGDDTYRLGRGQRGFGASDFREEYRVPDLGRRTTSTRARTGFCSTGEGAIVTWRSTRRAVMFPSTSTRVTTTSGSRPRRMTARGVPKTSGSGSTARAAESPMGAVCAGRPPGALTVGGGPPYPCRSLFRVALCTPRGPAARNGYTHGASEDKARASGGIPRLPSGISDPAGRRSCGGSRTSTSGSDTIRWRRRDRAHPGAHGGPRRDGSILYRAFPARGGAGPCGIPRSRRWHSVST